MRILIDECLDWRLCRALSGHDCVSVQKLGWGGLTNGALLRKAEQDFDIFITGDRNLIFQQQLSNRSLRVLPKSIFTKLSAGFQLVSGVFGDGGQISFT